MNGDYRVRTMVSLIAIVVVCAALYLANTVFAPLTLALFIVAIVWPLQCKLQSRLPKLIALAISIGITVIVCLAFVWLAVWGFGRIARALIADATPYQALYDHLVTWLEGHGISVAGLWAEHFDVSWLVRAVQQILNQINSMTSFSLVVLIYVILGLLEVDDMRLKIQRMENREAARILLDGAAASAQKFRKYMLVRTQMSVLTGALVFACLQIAGLRFAAEWGVIAFVLNYIPFIGPFIATLFPTMFAVAQFEVWQSAVGVFVCLNIVQFVVGSYIEPRICGNVLSISPFVVLFSVFFWTFLWGLFGAFIGVPIMIAILTYCEQSASSRWLADLLGGPARVRTGT